MALAVKDFAIKDFLRANWPVVAITAIVVAILGAAFMLLRTMPPRTIVMATGPEGGAYHVIGRRYRELLARDGVTLRLRPTSGALENLALLRDPGSGVSVALIQGGIAGEGQAGDLESLGTMFYEPFLLFYRSELRGLALHGLRGRKLSIGPEGSGTHMLSLELLKRNGVDLNAVELLALTPQAAGEKLLAGEIDAAMMLISWDAPVVRTLIGDERVELASFPYADAYVALYPFLSKVTVPAGVGDLAKPRGAQRHAFRDPIPVADRRDADPFAARHFPARRAVSRRRGDRISVEQRRAPVLQIRAAVPAELSAILGGLADRAARHSGDPTARHSLPADAVPAGAVWLGHAIEDFAVVWRIAFPGG
jgi:TRAP-type uncharacterized transport system substrate-binding protein